MRWTPLLRYLGLSSISAVPACFSAQSPSLFFIGQGAGGDCGRVSVGFAKGMIGGR
jgi:hypothetical protein